jgi:hypothetical protein
MFERPSVDAMSIEKTASQKSASKVGVSVCPQAKARLLRGPTRRVSFMGFVGHTHRTRVLLPLSGVVGDTPGFSSQLNMPLDLVEEREWEM